MIGNAETFRGWNNYMEAPMFYCGLLSLVAAPQVFYFGNRKSRIIYGVLLGLCFWVMLFPYFRYTFWLFTGDYYRTLGLFTLFALLYLNLKAIQQILEEKKIGLIALLATVVILFIILFGLAPDENLNKSLQKTAALLIVLYAGVLFLISKRALQSVGLGLLLLVCMGEMAFFSNNTTVNKRNRATKQEMNEAGNGYNEQLTSSTVYYTFDHIDLENDLIRRALASALQRDGVAVSLGDGFNMIDKSIPIHGWSGLIEDELEFTVCDDSGETEYGDVVGVALATTWIEI
jgi:glucan phosphoethanolaminetransferase (alkaline phosphatase superfamily)